MPIFTLELRNNGAAIAAGYAPTSFYLTSLTQTIILGPINSHSPSTHGFIEIDEVQLSHGGWSNRFRVQAPGAVPGQVNRIHEGSEITILLQGPKEARMVERSADDVAAMARLMASIV